MADHDQMLADLEKQLSGLEGQLEELLAKAGEDKKETETVKRFRPEDVEKAKDDNDDDEDREDDNDEDDWEKKAPTKVAKSDKSKSDVKKAKAEEKVEVEKAAGDDETISIEGQTIAKSAVGEAQFAIFKAQADKLAKAEEDIAKERDLRITAELKKQAEDLYKHVPGTTDEKAQLLKSMSKLDKPVREHLEKVLKAAEGLAKTAFDSLGSAGGREPANSNTFMAKVAEIKKRDNCSQTEALTKARAEHPEDFKAYQGQ